jgi:hypothetical protein
MPDVRTTTLEGTSLSQQSRPRSPGQCLLCSERLSWKSIQPQPGISDRYHAQSFLLPLFTVLIGPPFRNAATDPSNEPQGSTHAGIVAGRQAPLEWPSSHTPKSTAVSSRGCSGWYVISTNFSDQVLRNSDASDDELSPLDSPSSTAVGVTTSTAGRFESTSSSGEASPHARERPLSYCGIKP